MGRGGINWEIGIDIYTLLMLCINQINNKALQYSTSEKATAPHSSTLAWKIPWTEEPGRLQSMGLLESDTTERLHFHALEKAMTTHSSVLAWRIPGAGKPGGLPSMGSQSWTRLK